MWPTGGGYYWPQAAPANQSAQQGSNPAEWAVKAAQWAQQRTAQEQVYRQQLQYQHQQMVAIPPQPTSIQQYQQTAYSQPAAAAQPLQQQSIPPLLVSQPTPPLQPPTPAQPTFYPPPQLPAPPQSTPPQPLFTPPKQPSAALSSRGLGPGDIDKPPKSEPTNYYGGSDFYGDDSGGFRGHESRPPKREFQPNDKSRKFGVRGPSRGNMRPRMPRPPAPRERGPSPHQWDARSEYSEQQNQRQPRNTYQESPSHGGYQHDDGDRRKWNEEKSKQESSSQVSQIADDVDEALYAKEPDIEPPSFKEDLPSKSVAPAPPQVLVKRLMDSEYDTLYGEPEQTKTPTIASLRKDNEDTGAIPGLGEISSEPPTDPSPPTPATTTKESPKADHADKMLASLGKLMTELQGLKGLTSSLQLLQSLPRAEEKQLTDKEVSEEAKQKAAALLANESDSEEESQPQPTREHPPEPRPPVYTDKEPIRSTDAREFEGYNVKPEVYGTYPHRDNYPPDAKPPTDYRGGGEYPHGDYDRVYDYPESRPPPPKEYYPQSRDHYEGRDYPPRSEPLYRERGDWMESRDYPPPRGGYQNEDYSSSDRYPPSDIPPIRDRHPPSEIAPLREGREASGRYPPVPDGPPPVRERRFPEEEFRRPPPVRDEYGYGRLAPPSRSERYHESGRPFSAANIESYDYGHGGAPAIVDYNHGKAPVVTEPPPEPRQNEPPYSAVEGFPPQPPAVGGYNYSPGMPYFPAGMDPAQAALIAAAYSAQAGEAKRKVLPAWLKDELEKMEAKRQKELDKEKEAKERGVQEGRATWRDEIESDEEEERKKEEKKGRAKRSYRQKSPSPKQITESFPPSKRKKSEPVALEDDEEREVTKIMKIRRMLTEILLEVTNQEIDVIAKEVIEEEKKPKPSFAFKGPVSSQPASTSVLAGLSMYDSGSESEQDDKKNHRKNKETASPKASLDPLAIAKAFASTVADPNLPPPSKEHQEWAEKILDLPPRSRKDSSKKHSRSEEKGHHSDRRSSQEEHDYHHSSKSTHKKSSRGKEDSSKKRSSHSHSKSSNSPIRSRKSSSQRKSHSPPPPSGMSLAAGFPAPKSLAKPSKGRSPSPRRRSQDKKRSHRSRSRSFSPSPGHKVNYKNKSSHSRSPTQASQRHLDKGGSGKPSRDFSGPRPSSNYRIVSTRK